MHFSRRQFLQLLAIAGAAACTRRSSEPDLYDLPPFGNISLLHISDSHGQLTPLYLREPSWHQVGEQRIDAQTLLKNASIPASSATAHALTPADFVALAREYGTVGGYAYLATLIKSLRDQRAGRSLLFDGGSSLNGTATAQWTDGQDMIDAQRLLGVDFTTGHGEFFYGAERAKTLYQGSSTRPVLLAANIDDAVWGTRPFPASTVRELNGVHVGVIGLAYPHFAEVHSQQLCPDWRFSLDETQIQQRVDELRGKTDIIVILSHSGLAADLKLAARLHGVDVILSGHSHDAFPQPFIINNAAGRTVVISSGAHGKFVSVLDLQVGKGKMRDYRYRLVPIFSNRIAVDARMAAHIEKTRAPYREKLSEALAHSESLLYRRDPFLGTMDQLLMQAMRTQLETEIAFVPGYRWGADVLPGETLTLETVMNQTAVPNGGSCQVGERTGEEIKTLLERYADLTFNKDAYLQHGYDMLRTGGLYYRIKPGADFGQRISELRLADGRAIDASKVYKVASWGIGEPREGAAIWDVVSEYLRKQQTIKIDPAPSPLI